MILHAAPDAESRAQTEAVLKSDVVTLEHWVRATNTAAGVFPGDGMLARRRHSSMKLIQLMRFSKLASTRFLKDLENTVACVLPPVLQPQFLQK